MSEIAKELWNFAEKGNVQGVLKLLGRVDAADFLFQQKHLMVNQRGEWWFTPLMVAAARGHAHVVEVLLIAGADVNGQDAYAGSTALIWASAMGHTSVIRVLLRMPEININMTNHMFGRSALMYAARYERPDVVRQLLQRKDIRLDLVNNCGKTAIEQTRCVEVVRLLTAHARPVSNI